MNAEIRFEAFCCRHINFETVFQSALEHAIFIQKIEKKSGEGCIRPLGAYGASAPLLRGCVAQW